MSASHGFFGTYATDEHGIITSATWVGDGDSYEVTVPDGITKDVLRAAAAQTPEETLRRAERIRNVIAERAEADHARIVAEVAADLGYSVERFPEPDTWNEFLDGIDLMKRVVQALGLNGELTESILSHLDGMRTKVAANLPIGKVA